MKSFPLNLSKFTKISSDKEHTMLRAPEGHEIKIKHSALHPKMREQLAAIPMAKGGNVKDPTQEHLLPGDKIPNKIEKNVVKHTKTEMMFEGGPSGHTQEMVGPEEAYPEQPKGKYGAATATVRESSEAGDVAPPKTQSQKEHEDFARGATQPVGTAQAKAKGGAVKAYDEGTPDAPVDSQPMSVNVNPQFDSSLVNPNPGSMSAQRAGPAITESVPQAPDQYGVNPEEFAKMQEASKIAVAPAAPTPAEAAKVPASPSEQQQDINTNPILTGIQEEKKGLEQQYLAGKSLAEGQQAALQQDQQAREKAAGNYAARTQGLDQERQSFVQDLQNSHVDPNHYLNSLGTIGRIKSTLGIILGGGGGGTNQALNFLNQQIDRDVEAQKQNIGIKQNLLTANLRQFGNLRDATDMTRVMQNDAVSHQMQMAAAKAGTQQAMGNYLQAKGALDQKSAMLMATIGARQTINQPNINPLEANHALNVLRMVDPAQAKEVESRYVPNMGIATIPVPENVRAQLTERKTLGDNIQQLIGFQKKYGGSLEGIADPNIRAQGEALAKQVQDQYRRANQQGVFKPAEAAFVNGVIADSPSSLFSRYTKAPAYRSAAMINQGNLNQLKASYGLRIPPPIQMGPPPASPFKKR